MEDREEVDQNQLHSASVEELDQYNSDSQLTMVEKHDKSEQLRNNEIDQAEKETGATNNNDKEGIAVTVRQTQYYEEDDEEVEDPNTALKERQLYNSIQDLRAAATRYAKKRRFAVVTLRSGERQVVLTCKHAGTYRPAVKKQADEAGEQEPARAQNDTPSAGTEGEEADKEKIDNSTGDTDASNQGKRARSAGEEEEASANENKGHAKKRNRKSQRIQCPFQIKAKPAGDGQWIVHKIHDDHNHEMASDIAAYPQYRRISDEMKRIILELFRLGAPVRVIADYMVGKGLDNVVIKDISNVRSVYLRKRRKQLQASIEAANEDGNGSAANNNPKCSRVSTDVYEDLEPLDTDTINELHEFLKLHNSKTSAK